MGNINTRRIALAVIQMTARNNNIYPMVMEQTINEWFADNKGYDVNLFVIVDESAWLNGEQ